MSWHNKKIEDVAKELGVKPSEGLSSSEAAARLEKYGQNVLAEKKGKNPIVRFFEQFKDFMVIVLLVAAIVSLATSAAQGHPEYLEVGVILLIVILNAVLGLVQESKAEKALEALKKMSAPYAKVRRDGAVASIPASQIVPGDVLILEAGDLVSADGRLIHSASLKAEESALTGESVPVEKISEALETADIALGDRVNMVISSSSITYGRGEAIVTSTGMQTEVGKIADMIMQDEGGQTPLQIKLAQIGKTLGLAALAICALIFFVGLLQQKDPIEMFMTAVSLAVAAIPEGLPAIVTIVLAVGVQRMVKKNAIIRKLPAVETLGSASVICSDKTGTLTQNRMTVIELTDGSGKKGSFTLELATLCNDSILDKQGESYTAMGDPTETAMVVKAAEQGLLKDELDKRMPRVAEVPFDSERKLMTTVHKLENGMLRVATKGAPDVLLQRSTHILVDNKTETIGAHAAGVDKDNTSMADKALRVLGVAYKDVDKLPDEITSEALEQELVFVGLIGMIDPPRLEVKDSVRLCAKAGIRPVMITGDHKATAVAIAKDLEIFRDGDTALTGAALDQINDDELVASVDKYSVYARVSPEHKVRIVKAWQSKGQIVAMTGDGVNDAPALKTADIGCAMGITGTDVSKGAADMVLTDDNFSTIVAAVQEGRGIFDNILKSIQFLLSCNVGEIVALFTATMLPMFFKTIPLIPIQILWVNLVTDSLPALALGVQPVEDDVMERKPRDAKANVFSGGLAATVLWQGIMIGALTLAAYLLGGTEREKCSMAFAVLAFSQLVHAFNTCSYRSVFKSRINKFMYGAFAISGLLQISVFLIPFLQDVFEVENLNRNEWLIVVALSLMPLVIVELVKLIKRLIRK